MPPRATPLVLVVSVLVFAAFGGFLQPTEATAANPTRAEKVLIRAINNARENHGARRLRVAAYQQARAHRWARSLLRRDAFYHSSMSSGTTENIGWLTCRRGWARAMVRWWLSSPAHRANLLDRTAHRLGAGVATGRWKGYGCVRIMVVRFR